MKIKNNTGKLLHIAGAIVLPGKISEEISELYKTNGAVKFLAKRGDIEVVKGKQKPDKPDKPEKPDKPDDPAEESATK